MQEEDEEEGGDDDDDDDDDDDEDIKGYTDDNKAWLKPKSKNSKQLLVCLLLFTS